MMRAKKIKLILGTTLSFVLLCSLFTSCVRERDFDITAADDNMFALFVYDDAINIANEAQSLVSGDLLYSYDGTSTCVNITRNSNNVVVDFGEDNCLNNDGRMRRGKLLLNYTGNYKDSGETRTITFENYYVDDQGIGGSVIIEGMGPNTNGDMDYAVTVAGEIAVDDTLGTYVYNAELNRTQTSGFGTVVWGDDIYELSGSSLGNDIYGNSIAMRITEPVIKLPSFVCRHLQEGTVEVQPQGRTFRSIYLGNGSCDATATVTIDTKEHNMTLR